MKNNSNLNPIKPGLLTQAERKNFSPQKYILQNILLRQLTADLGPQQ